MQKTVNNTASEKYLEQVSEFHTLMKQPILEKPIIPTEDRSSLRISLIQEELNEFKEAIEKGDIVEALDALCDLQYVVSGSILEFGMKEIFPEAFAEVHRSNMSKACSNIEEAEETMKHYLEKDNVETYIVKRDSRFFVLRKHDHKQLKSINYSPAALKQFLNAERDE